MLGTFAYDGRFVYMIVLAAFGTHIARIDVSTGKSRHFAYAVGRPSSLVCDDGKLYYTCHRSVADSRPALKVYDANCGALLEAAELLYVELPCARSAGIAVREGRVMSLGSGRATITSLNLR
jgi:hypothetical protein